jgi:predicted nucleic acid-binding Zn ribbon protein
VSKNDRKASNLSHVANVLQSLLQSSKSPLSEQFIRWRLWSEWESIVGAEIAKNSMPVGYLNGTLYVWVKSAPRMQEMTFMVRPLREKINKFAGKYWVNSIRFTLDRKAVPQTQEGESELRDFINKDSTKED